MDLLPLSLLLLFLGNILALAQEPSASEQMDAYLDTRFESKKDDTKALLQQLEKAGVKSMEELEAALRAPRSNYPEETTSPRHITCLHVDYSTQYHFRLPKNFDSSKPSPLLLVGHGGNSSMSHARADSTAKMYLQAYRSLGDQLNAITIAPISTRGWGHIGNSLLLSVISDLKRRYPIDPDRIYLTGQSMGGHMTYRAALLLPDRWAAVSPHSGGYNFVEKNSIFNLRNVPGYAVWGKSEPYGINTDNRVNKEWAEGHLLNWKFVEKNGGHTIYPDEFPAIAKFFLANKRNLYPKTIVMRMGGAMKFTKTWEVKGWPKHTVYHEEKPLRWDLRHWVQLKPRPDSKDAMELKAQNLGDNKFQITSKNVRNLTLYFHPKMISFDKPVTITVNGKKLHEKMVGKDPDLMLDLARQFDDRGRLFWGKITLAVTTDLDPNLLEK